MPHPRYSTDEIVERGEELYNRSIRENVETKARGKFLALNVDNGEFEIDADEVAAVERALAKHPDAPLYLLRIGSPTAYRLGRKSVVSF